MMAEASADSQASKPHQGETNNETINSPLMLIKTKLREDNAGKFEV